MMKTIWKYDEQNGQHDEHVKIIKPLKLMEHDGN